ncbi:hypothetical protein ACQKGL_19030 [Ensifer adhaerens]|uniref:hypothetical protein n=1 Tax=Ensifer adhaerens TaxID=106592 RepID=UPI003D06F306
MTEPPRLDVEASWKALEMLSNGTASVRAVVEQSEHHGLFRYSIEQYFGPAEEDEGQWPQGFWQATSRSGLYASVIQTVKEAQVSLHRTQVHIGDDI